MRLLGLDVGSKNIGLAICDEDELVATPLRVLERQGGQRDLDAIATALSETGAGALVLGLPLTLTGEQGAMARKVRRFGDRLAAELSCPVHYYDERFSSAEAERVLLEADVSRSKRKKVIDQLAAAVILQGFLDSRRAASAMDRGAAS